MVSQKGIKDQPITKSTLCLIFNILLNGLIDNI